MVAKWPILKLSVLCAIFAILTCMEGCTDSYSDLPFPYLKRMAGIEQNDENRKKMDVMGGQLIDALINKDIDALKNIMSPAAIVTEDFEKGFEYSCSFFDEKIVSREMGGSHHGGHLGVSTFGGTFFKLTTVNKNEIFLSFECYFTDSRNPDNIGVCALVVTTKNSIQPDEQSDYIRNRFGIFNPEWNNVKND